MIKGKKVLGVIPARGGSKGVALKNLRKVNGQPLVTIASQISRAVKYIDRTVVSTDHEKIAEAAVKGGAEAPFRRPAHLSGDRISDLQVLSHAMTEMESQSGEAYDIVVMLQPTSPMRTVAHVNSAIEMLVEGGFDSVWTVSETDSKAHPLKQLTVRNGKLNYYDEKGKTIIARQQLDPVYHRNGIAYAITRQCLFEKKSIMGDNTGALTIEGEHVSIDTEWDFELVELTLARNKK